MRMKHIILEGLDFAGGLHPSGSSLGEVLFTWWILYSISATIRMVVKGYSYIILILVKTLYGWRLGTFFIYHYRQGIYSIPHLFT